MPGSVSARILNKIDTLPSLPEAVTKLLVIMDNPESTVNEIVTSMDPTTCATILKVSNSAYYSSIHQVKNIAHAIAILGRNTIKEMLLGLTVVTLFDKKDKGKEELYYRFWQKTVISTQLAIMFGKLTGNSDISKIYTLGLIHDIGEIIFFLYFTDDYLKAVSLAEKKKIKLSDAEKEIFGISHPHAGALLAQKWKLPGDMTRVIRCHETPGMLEEEVDEMRVGMILKSADAITNELMLTEEWDLIFNDDEKLKGVFAAMGTLATALTENLLKHGQKQAAKRSWKTVTAEELELASQKIKPLMNVLLSIS
ncbi:MAG: HDOD domain-containing protein [Nitrospinota bacterium]